MRKAKKYDYASFRSNIIDNPLAVVIVGILAIFLGLFFWLIQGVNKPIPREEATSYVGQFDYYFSSRRYCEIHFKDGSVLYVYPHTETAEFRKTMEALDDGTQLYILINPNNNYVAEIKTDTRELLNFEISQQDIDSYDNGYIAIGVFLCVCGVFLIMYVIGSTNYKKTEKKKIRGASTPLRCADETDKGRILLEATEKNYRICYRRIKTTNELVVNGQVYDEKKGLFEFEHKLCAFVNGHNIEAGYDKEGFSYIAFNGRIINKKRRYI